MPLRDHFHPPLSTQRHWESFHTTWAGAIADALNDRWLPEGYFAEEQVHPTARVEIDVATFETLDAESKSPDTSSIATAPRRTWSPPAPAETVRAAFPPTFEVLVFRMEGGPTLVAAIELVSPANKDRDDHRRAFAVKCASFLLQGVSLVVIDVVTTRHADLHREVLRLIDAERVIAEQPQALCTAAYRPVRRDEEDSVEVWRETLAVDAGLPVMPLCLGGDVFVPLDLEETYTDACRRRRIE